MNQLDLQVLVAVAEELSFTRAAQRLGLSRSGISQRVARMERNAGGRIFDRTTRSVRLTQHGLVLLDAAVTILEQWHRTTGAPAPRPSTALRVALNDRSGTALLHELGALLPGHAVQTSVGEPAVTVGRIDRGELDAAASYHHPGRFPSIAGNTHVRTLLSEPIEVLCGVRHRLARTRTVTLGDLRAERWIVAHTGTPTHAWEHGLLRATGITDVVTVTPVTALQLVMEGAGIALGGALGPLAGSGLLTVIPLESPRLWFHHFLAWDAHRVPVPTADRLHQILLRSYAGRISLAATHRARPGHRAVGPR